MTTASGLAHLSPFVPHRILIFRALQVGDMLCAVPALRALRIAFPEAHITLAGLPWAAAFARRFSGYIDDFLSFSGHPLLPEQPAYPQRFEAFVDDANQRETDLVLQMHGSGEVSNAIVSQLNARRHIAFGQQNIIPGFSTLRYPTHGHEIERLLALARFAVSVMREQMPVNQHGTEFNSELEFPIDAADRIELKRSRLNLRRHGYLCIHPGARDRSKCWPAEYFAQVADRLSVSHGLQVVLTGSSAERQLAGEVAAAMQAPAINAACDMSLGALAALLRDARLLICNDTAVSHLAAALSVPSVVIFQRSEVSRWAPMDRALHRVVCAGTGTGPVWMSAGVLTAANELMSRDRE